ncbi:peptide ABC transporter permease [Mycolicibacterium agri]|uniref:Peptide ABC transporter permease n=1 Tax=Mycolicibacterium agri TaxID=36811 RepID=A0A2A7MU98_MYCAG|nr:ABC transporter permease [Mycolicibacterium agri]PEG34891.1 peptide ABC transporter permease [Mycolicibacterium agri]GFG50484.1 peptide ABC transporter permease [Mycolicibacterium agri]
MQVRDYVIRRLIKLPLVIVAVTIGVFMLSRIGGSPIAIYIEHEMSRDEIAALEQRYGLNDPLPVQYLRWLWGVLHGDLGWSGVSVAPVADVLPSRFIATMELATLGALIAIGLGIGLGTFAGARHNKLSDHLTRIFTVTGASLPLFWFALLMLILFYLIIPIVPLGRFDEGIYATINHYTGFYTLDSLLSFNLTAFWDALKHLALPAFVLGFEGMAVTARMMRSSLVEEMNEDYVDSARAKGLPERLVIKRHARRNALIPTVTVVGMSWGVLLQGSVVVENVFRWPGLGRWATEGVIRGDRATIMAFVLVTAVVFLVVNLIVDVIYAYLDPRVTLGADA